MISVIVITSSFEEHPPPYIRHPKYSTIFTKFYQLVKNSRIGILNKVFLDYM